MTHNLFPHSDLPTTLADLKGDVHSLQMLAAEFVKRYPEQTIALAAAFRAHDNLTLGKRLHQARGALGVFRATQALALANRLEQQVLRGDTLAHEPFYSFLNGYIGLGLDLCRFLDNPALLRAPDSPVS